MDFAAAQRRSPPRCWTSSHQGCDATPAIQPECEERRPSPPASPPSLQWEERKHKEGRCMPRQAREEQQQGR